MIDATYRDTIFGPMSPDASKPIINFSSASLLQLGSTQQVKTLEPADAGIAAGKIPTYREHLQSVVTALDLVGAMVVWHGVVLFPPLSLSL